MEKPALKISVQDVVLVYEGVRSRERARGPVVAPFQPQFVFAMDKDVAWAPSRSRAPSVTIDFDLFEGGY